MKRTLSLVFVALACFYLGQGCNCGAPPVVADAGPCATASPCGACPSGCTNADTCDDANGWQCSCSCTVNTTNLCTEYAKRACDFFIRCHAEDSLFFDATEGRGPTPPTPSNNRVAESERAKCEAALSTSSSCFMVLESFKANRTRFDPVAYSACQAALYPADTCARDLNALQDLCLKTSFVVGASQAGATCQSDRECASGWCDAPSGGCGTCQPYVAVSGTCSRNAQCDPASSYCSANAGTCQPFRAESQSCQLQELTSCGPDRQCVLGPFGFFSGTCKAGKAEGAACNLGRYECARSNRALPELLCAPQSTDGGTANLCVKLQSSPGGHCGDGELVVPDPNNPNGGLKGPLCPESQYCQGNLCVEKKPAGASCAAEEECAAGLRCADAGGGVKTCQAYATTGASCAATADCQNLLSCGGASTCAPDLALEGQPCPTGVTCAVGYCDTTAATPTCAPFKSEGTNCAGNAECRSDVCATTCQKACWQAP